MAGCYAVEVFVRGIKTPLVLDDYFPCDPMSGKPLFARPQGNELWVLLLEKAWAKINGSYGNIDAGICSSSGIFDGEDVIKLILAGADCVQCVSTLYQKGIGHISKMLDDVASWMKDKGYKKLDDFRGKLSMKNQIDPYAYERAQYVDLLMKGTEVIKKDFKR